MALLGELHADVAETSLLIMRRIGFMTKAQLPCFAHFLFGALSCLVSSLVFL